MPYKVALKECISPENQHRNNARKNLIHQTKVRKPRSYPVKRGCWVRRGKPVLELPKKRMFQPEDIQRIRMANRMSQTVFAVILGVGKTMVQQWEQGLKRPGGTAQLFLMLLTVRE
jgi:DNA-binding transcriptional regulator YiaG